MEKDEAEGLAHIIAYGEVRAVSWAVRARLREKGFVERTGEGTHTMYQVTKAGFTALETEYPGAVAEARRKP
jgi:predicted MarR family transcription regulator